MAIKNHRAGGKYTASHTTTTPFAASVADIISRIFMIHKISIGIITQARGTSGGRRVRIIGSGCSIKLTVCGNRTVQELTAHVSPPPTADGEAKTQGAVLQEVKLDIARRLRNAGVNIAFREISECSLPE